MSIKPSKTHKIGPLHPLEIEMIEFFGFDLGVFVFIFEFFGEFFFSENEK